MSMRDSVATSGIVEARRASLPARAWRAYRRQGFRPFVYAVAAQLYCTYTNRQLSRLLAPSPNGYVEKEINGSRMYLDPTDKGLSIDLLVDGIREPYITEVTKRELKQGQTVVDIGANIGYYALLEARQVGPTGRVYAIEPVPENFATLNKNVRLNQYRF